jgi:hypothetical protein
VDLPEVRAWLNRYSALICHADAHSVSELWEVPASIISEDADTSLESAAEVEAYIAREQTQYQSTGVSSTIPRVEESEDLAPDAVALQVLWTNLDYDDHEIGRDRVNFVLHRGADGKYRVRITTPLTRAE